MSIVDRYGCEYQTGGTPRANPAADDDFWYSSLPGRGSTAGQNVNATSAERVAAVYACKLAIAESIAMLPLTLYDETDPENREERKEESVYRCLRHKPNRFMDSFTWFETMQTSLLDYGNAYAHILEDRAGSILELMPLAAERMRVEKVGSGNYQQLRYTYTNDGQQEEYGQEEIFHIRYRSKDGIMGRSPISDAAASFGFSLALLEHGNAVFQNGLFPSGVASLEGHFKDDEARDAWVASFHKYMGASNSGKIALFEDGMKFAPFQMTARDAQFLELKDASVLDVCRIFRIPPVLAQYTQNGMSYASIEQLGLFFRQHTMLPWATRWERAIKGQLLDRSGEVNNLYARFNMDVLERADIKSRTEAIVKQLQFSLATINEGRRLLDRNRLKSASADEGLITLQVQPLSRLDEKPKEPPAIPPALPQAPVEPADDEDEESDKEALPEEQNEDSEAQARHFQPLFASLISRIMTREQKALNGAVKRGGYMAWAEGYLDAERGLLSETLAPACEAFLGFESTAALPRFVGRFYEQRQLDLLELQAAAWQSADAAPYVEILTNLLIQEERDA